MLQEPAGSIVPSIEIGGKRESTNSHAHTPTHTQTQTPTYTHTHTCTLRDAAEDALLHAEQQLQAARPPGDGADCMMGEASEDEDTLVCKMCVCV